jgi:hypothetical protein
MGANDLDSKTYDRLLAGDNVLLVTAEGIVLSGAGVLTRGAVLGKVTASGKLVLVDSDGTDDGRRTPYAILAEDIDASSADHKVVVYLAGEFNEDALTFGTGDTKETHRAALRDLNIYLKTTIAA